MKQWYQRRVREIVKAARAWLKKEKKFQFIHCPDPICQRSRARNNHKLLDHIKAHFIGKYGGLKSLPDNWMEITGATLCPMCKFPVSASYGIHTNKNRKRRKLRIITNKPQLNEDKEEADTSNVARLAQVLTMKELPHLDGVVRTQAMCCFKVLQGARFEWARMLQLR
eukprot:TRINITY_DN2408_c0_g2_i1.p4 TRINITY_DN2408_c0_g2~~TRINITY_DN2408_c0_g2_i1.p4  ORF type:complete len:168 (+),score=31.59 TRINITY_DN2408_c0_g2_i1:106-609(+)